MLPEVPKSRGVFDKALIINILQRQQLDVSRKIPEKFPKNSRKIPEKFPKNSRKIPEKFPKNPCNSGKIRFLPTSSGFSSFMLCPAGPSSEMHIFLARKYRFYDTEMRVFLTRRYGSQAIRKSFTGGAGSQAIRKSDQIQVQPAPAASPGACGHPP